MENGTSIEYFNKRYIMQVKDKIKVYEEGKKAARTQTQAQQTKLLLEARGGGQTKSNQTLKRHVKQNIDEEADDQQEDYPMNIDDDDQDDQQIIVEQATKLPADWQPRQTPKPKPMQTTKKQPQINYTSPQIDLEELIHIRTENSFIKQQHQESIKQVEKYKAKIRDYKQKKLNDEQAEQIQTPPQEQFPEYQEQKQQQQELRFNETDLW
ncbi:MAG: hypothetical protein EZS28_035805 [Streblomastix strix]|uniref:Uncharacterized protein n=1 Tax=Streblomastix strix TaxID=222440 RepID=A0A5J4UE06_9EUKA|nr:MAG: hypothetical protein EZS28_035805 [Streblomastix strix]